MSESCKLGIKDRYTQAELKTELESILNGKHPTGDDWDLL